MNTYNQSDPADTSRPASPAPTRRRKRKGGYRYYLEDHPVLAPVVTLLLGGLCIYGTIFTHLIENLMLGTNADGSTRANFGAAMAWGVAFVVGLMGLALIFLLWHLLEEGIRTLRRRPAVCPRCGTVEVRQTRPFTHAREIGTRWENVTCPQCRHSWHARL